MKKLLSLALVLVMVLTFASCGEKPVYRNVSFGMSAEDVKQAEIALTPVSEEEKGSNSAVTYDISYNTENLLVSYAFSDDQLVDVLITCDNVNTLESYIRELYGEPTVSLNHVSGWYTEDYEIELATIDGVSAYAVIK